LNTSSKSMSHKLRLAVAAAAAAAAALMRLLSDDTSCVTHVTLVRTVICCCMRGVLTCLASWSCCSRRQARSLPVGYRSGTCKIYGAPKDSEPLEQFLTHSSLTAEALTVRLYYFYNDVPPSVQFTYNSNCNAPCLSLPRYVACACLCTMTAETYQGTFVRCRLGFIDWVYLRDLCS
jgi:hypothetical protein